MRLSTRSRVCSLMSLWFRNAFETVIRDTPRSWAISFIRTAIGLSHRCRAIAPGCQVLLKLAVEIRDSGLTARSLTKYTSDYCVVGQAAGLHKNWFAQNKTRD